jgi:hypothetical protein
LAFTSSETPIKIHSLPSDLQSKYEQKNSESEALYTHSSLPERMMHRNNQQSNQLKHEQIANTPRILKMVIYDRALSTA